MKKLIVLTAVATLVLSACASEVYFGDTTGDSSRDSGQETLPTAPSDSSATTTTGQPTVEPGDPQPPTSGDGQSLPGTTVDDMLDLAVADLADRLTIDPDVITVDSVESVTWRDGSMGCPEPGISYTQALVDGFRIELTVDETSYWYHQGGSNHVRYCDAPNPETVFVRDAWDKDDSGTPTEQLGGPGGPPDK